MDPLYFRENESKGEDAIVFVSGGGISGKLWLASLQALTEYHCLAPDLPGHGKSAGITPFSLENSVEGLVELIQTNVPSGRAAVVGFSAGVAVSIELINRHPELVERAFLSGPTPRLGRFAVSMINAITPLFHSLLGSQRRAKFVARSMGLTDLTDDQFEALREDLDKLTPELGVQINDVVAGQADPHPNGPPTVVFVGEKDIGATKKRARALMKALGNSRGYVVSSLGHAWSLEKPDLFYRAVRAWMSDAELGEGFIPLAGANKLHNSG